MTETAPASPQTERRLLPNAVAAVMVWHNDPPVQGGALVIFPVLGALSWGGFLYLVRPKLEEALGRTRRAAAAH